MATAITHTQPRAELNTFIFKKHACLTGNARTQDHVDDG